MYKGEGQKRKFPSLATSLRHILCDIGSRLHDKTRCRKIYAGNVFEWQLFSMDLKETFGNGCRPWGIMPTASQLAKKGKMQSAGCQLCRRAREARGESTDSLVVETYGHINSAGCEGMVSTFTASHHSIWKNLYDSIHAAQKPKSKLKFVTLDQESVMSTLWLRKEFLWICSEFEASKIEWRRHRQLRW